MYFICDPRYNWGYPQRYDGTPQIREDGLIWWKQELREIYEIHKTHNGTQIELF